MNDKLLAEYCGLCWHEFVEGTTGDYDHCKNCGVTEFNARYYDFSTPEGYELLHKAIGEKGDWDDLYSRLVVSTAASSNIAAGIDFHELPCAEKSQIISEWLGAKQ